MNPRKSLYDVKTFYNKGAVHKASFGGMRYLVKKILVEVPDQDESEEVQKEPKLQGIIWPEPFCFEKTDSSLYIKNEFQYTEEGLDECYEWLCNTYEEKFNSVGVQAPTELKK